MLFDGHYSFDFAVFGGVTIIFGIVRAVSAASGVIIIVGLATVSRDVDGAFLVWGWVVLVFSFVSFSGMIEVWVLVEELAGSPVSCCSE